MGNNFVNDNSLVVLRLSVRFFPSRIDILFVDQEFIWIALGLIDHVRNGAFLTSGFLSQFWQHYHNARRIRLRDLPFSKNDLFHRLECARIGVLITPNETKLGHACESPAGKQNKATRS